MHGRRVVITGIGVVSSIGIGRERFSQALLEGRSGVSTFHGWNAQGFPFDQGGEVKDFEPRQWLRVLDPNATGRTTQMAIAAAYQAVEDSRLPAETLRRASASVSLGTTDGESYATDTLVRQIKEKGIRGVEPSLVRMIPADRLSSSVAREFGLNGEAMTISTACAAGNYAIGNGYDLIRSQEADYVLAGGAESIARKSLAGFYRLGAIAPVKCQPFDANRKGIIAGEGAGVVLLENRDSALRRGARIYAELLGYGLSCDAKHSTSPDSQSIAICMKRAHSRANVRTEDIDYICAHGTGTAVNDALETKAILEVFGGRPPAISSIKSMLGHTMGAASAFGVVACALAIHEQFIPPTINFSEPDPECPLDCVPNVARRARVRVTQNNAFAFGGNNAIVVMAAHGDVAPAADTGVN
jgi:3-oxoacyl-[acyl-carrier-protein] synthase II